MLIYIAQTAEAAKESVGVLQTILEGGLPLMLLVIAVILGWVIYKQNERIAELEKEFRTDSKSLLQDQIAEAKPLTEALTKTNDVMGRVDRSLKDATDTMTRLNAKLDAQERSGG